jgi:hypothetical protein
MTLNYLPEAVPTAIGWAHPLTGEQLTSGALTAAQLDGQTAVAYYKPNARDKAFLDPAGGTRNLILSRKTGRKVRFAIQSLDNVASVAWSFGDRGVASTTITAPGTGYTTATVAFTAAPAGGVTATGTVTLLAGAVTGIVVTNPGAGYTAAPTPTISGNGTGATATSTLTAASVAGGAMSVHNYQAAGTFDISAVVSYVGGTPANATLTINDLVIA